jgi:hypothetical protein
VVWAKRAKKIRQKLSKNEQKFNRNLIKVTKIARFFVKISRNLPDLYFNILLG